MPDRYKFKGSVDWSYGKVIDLAGEDSEVEWGPRHAGEPVTMKGRSGEKDVVVKEANECGPFGADVLRRYLVKIDGDTRLIASSPNWNDSKELEIIGYEEEDREDVFSLFEEAIEYFEDGNCRPEEFIEKL